MTPNLQPLSPQPQNLPDEIDVTLLLVGGQQYTITLEPDNALLHELFEVLVDTDGDQARRLFQIPIKRGRAILTFPSHRLIGIVTEPPLVIQQRSNTPTPSLASQTPALPPHDPLISEFIQIDNFLPQKDWQRLVKYTLEHKKDFVGTTTFTNASDYRKSVVLYSFPEFAELITKRIRQVVPDVLSKLRLPQFAIDQIESQLTAHNDGNFYKVHNDNGSPDTATRELTYVYYFHREPKGFSGGELLLYDSKVENNYYVQADTYRTVEPRNNSIVFFLSRYMHEVLPIVCPSQAFADSRFTINGWVRRK